MAGDDRLLRFVESALERGVPRERIASSLTAAGWRPSEMEQALDAFADSDLPVPVPRPRPYLSAKEAFLYLVLFTSLYLWCWHLGSLAFELIENAFPDPSIIHRWSSGKDAIRWSAAWLVVAFPVFLALSWMLERAHRAAPAKRGSKVRKWLTYLTLYVAATVILADCATLVYNALGGELTTRFLLKVATVGILSGGVFGYYLTDLRSEERGAD